MDWNVAKADAAERLRQAIADRGVVPTPSSLRVSPWLAMSILQKAIRRGDDRWALRAAATLLRAAPDRLWRRLGVIAFEDIGTADLETIELVTAAGAGRGRQVTASEWEVVSLLITCVARAPKCRAADDLLMVVDHHPALAEGRGASTRHGAPMRRSLPELALDLSAGSVATPVMRPHGADQVSALPDRAVWVARAGAGWLGHPLCGFLPLLAAARSGEECSFGDDDLPPETTVRGMPGWAFDMFVREGRTALKEFLRRSSRSGLWIEEHVPPSRRLDFLGNLVFAVEGGLLRARSSWPTATRLRYLAEIESQGPWCRDASEVLALLRDELPLLNRVRVDVL